MMRLIFTKLHAWHIHVNILFSLRFSLVKSEENINAIEPVLAVAFNYLN